MCDLNVICMWPASVIAYGSVCKPENFCTGGKGNLDKAEVTVGGPREEGGTTEPGLNCHARWKPDGMTLHKHRHKDTLHVSNKAPKAHNMYHFLGVTRCISLSHTNFSMLISWSALGLFFSRCEQTDHWPPGQFISLENSLGLYATAFLGVTSTTSFMVSTRHTKKLTVAVQWRLFCLQ